MDTGGGRGEDGSRAAAEDDVSVISRTTPSPAEVAAASSPSPGKAMAVVLGYGLMGCFRNGSSSSICCVSLCCDFMRWAAGPTWTSHRPNLKMPSPILKKPEKQNSLLFLKKKSLLLFPSDENPKFVGFIKHRDLSTILALLFHFVLELSK
jgi:hypothetical protein